MGVKPDLSFDRNRRATTPELFELYRHGWRRHADVLAASVTEPVATVADGARNCLQLRPRNSGILIFPKSDCIFKIYFSALQVHCLSTASVAGAIGDEDVPDAKDPAACRTNSPITWRHGPAGHSPSRPGEDADGACRRHQRKSPDARFLGPLGGRARRHNR